MTKMIISGRAQPNATVADAGVIYKKFRKLSMNAPLSDLASALDIEPYGKLSMSIPFFKRLRCVHSTKITLYSMPLLILVLVITEQRCFAGRKKKRSASPDGDQVSTGARSAEAESKALQVVKKQVVIGIVTRIDLLEYISNLHTDD